MVPLQTAIALYRLLSYYGLITRKAFVGHSWIVEVIIVFAEYTMQRRARMVINDRNARSVIRNAKNGRGLGRDRAAAKLSPIFPAAIAPFPKSCVSYFRFARFNTFLLYYLRAWHRLWMRLRRIWRIKKIEEGVIHQSRRLRWITPSEICLILHILQKPSSLIALLIIQNNS